MATIPGTSGNDILNSGAGDDFLAGGAGNDSAVFSGNLADYRFGTDAAGQLTVTDLNLADGDEGTDTLTGIQTLVFADRTVQVSSSGSNEFRVNSTTADNQSDPAVTALSDGGFLVSWTSWYQDGSNCGIYAQRYDASGVAAGGEFRVNSTTASDQGYGLLCFGHGRGDGRSEPRRGAGHAGGGHRHARRH